MTEKFRFGVRTYTVGDIRRIADSHGADGIMYYPPSRWGFDDNEPGCNPGCMNLDRIYREEYENGKARVRCVGTTDPT